MAPKALKLGLWARASVWEIWSAALSVCSLKQYPKRSAGSEMKEVIEILS